MNTSDASPARGPAPLALLYTDVPDQWLPLRPLPHRRPGQWKVKAPEGGIPGDPDVGGLEVPLSYVLLLTNRASLIDRYPVAVPAKEEVEELHRQLLRQGITGTIPVTATEKAAAWVCWLDRKQFDGARRFLGPDLVFVGARDDGHRGSSGGIPQRLDLPSGERMGGFYKFDGSSTPAGDRDPTPYKRIFPEWIDRGGAAGAQPLWQVAATSDHFSRGGQAVVRATREDSGGIRQDQLVVIHPARTPEHGHKMATLARLRLIEENPDDVPRQYRYLQVDQSIRDALGIEIGELARISPCKAPRRLKMFDWLVGAPTYVMCRVQSADSTTFEREVTLMGSLTLELLGVESGDTVVIEGIPEPGEGTSPRVPSERVKAFEVSEEVLGRRAQISGGDLTCRFPNSRDSFGTFPDLPWIFLDSTERTALGLAGQKLGVVRVRASRWYQLQKEFREVLLIAAIAFIGILPIFKGATRYALVGVLAFLIAAVVALRMGGRMSRKLKPPVDRPDLGQTQR